MEVRYSSHLKLRIALREIPAGLPREIYLDAAQRFIDAATGTEVAVSRVALHGKRRDVAVIYKRHGSDVLLITVHPLKPGQLQNRTASGRWKLIKR